MRIYVIRFVVTLTAGASLFGACGNDGSDTGPAKAADGAKLYQQSCASCHGTDLRGTDKGPAHLSIAYEPAHHSDEEFRLAVAEGVCSHHWGFGDMPPVDGLSATEVDAIIKYVREVQAREGFEYEPEMDHHEC